MFALNDLVVVVSQTRCCYVQLNCLILSQNLDRNEKEHKTCKCSEFLVHFEVAHC